MRVADESDTQSTGALGSVGLVTEPVQQTESSAELQLRVARFMSRAEEILEHPLAGKTSDFTVTLKANPETGQVVGADFDTNLQERNSWGHLATMLRPLIFLTNDDGSVGRLMSLIKRDHPRLREHGLEKLQQGIGDWRKQPIIAIQDLGPIDESGAEPVRGNVRSLWSGVTGSQPEGLNIDQLTPDFELAEIYFYGRMWHADAEKVDQFEQASPGMKALMAKCAEIRTLSAVQWVRYLHQWIVDARAAGWPL